MYLFFESIKCINGKLDNIDYHNSRVRKTLAAFYNGSSFDLSEIIVPDRYKVGLYKLRVIYSDKIEKFELLPYQKREIKSLKIIETNDINYNYKYFDRTQLNNFFSMRGKCDDIIILKNGLATDSSYSNLVFDDGINLFTPKTYLLKGTKISKLIDDSIVSLKEIKISEFYNFKQVHLINAMLDIGDTVIQIENIIQ
ncbi:MAG: hypothetical protein KIT33_07560 [Candidatus Kapabacteria bacterium]|nr:hypothetical protein [Ignavibacteriota bacterium]MCW5884810.1 hypothetical protein [Candidatus Kapabacteria bacterium]